MQTRRTILQYFTAASIFPLPARAQALPNVWEAWAAKYYRDGRVIDERQGGITHSEGQGYALLFAQAYGDRDRFAAIEAWTQQHLAVRQDQLMAWKWQPSVSDNIASWHNATDGDLFRAWALLRAARDSGWSEYRERAIGIARDIAALCCAPDPRAPQEWLLTPGAEARRTAARVLFNPSYILPRALRELGEAAAEPRLIRAADHGETVLAELAATGFLPNWVDITQDGFDTPQEHDFLWGYDALRVPLYLRWSRATDHLAIDLGRQYMDLSEVAGHVAVEVTATRIVREQSNHPGYLAVRQLASCDAGDDLAPPDAARDYYPDSLFLMARIAQRESVCGGPSSGE